VASRFYTGASPESQRLVSDRVRRQPPPAIARPALPHTPPLVGSLSRPSQLAPPNLGVAARPQRGGDAPRTKRPPHARAARRQRGGDLGAHQAQRGRRGQGERGASAGAAEHFRRKAARARRPRGGDRGAPRVRSDSRGPAELPSPVDGRRRGRRLTPPLPPARHWAARTRLCPRRAALSSALAHSPDPRPRTKHHAIGELRIHLIEHQLPAA